MSNKLTVGQRQLRMEEIDDLLDARLPWSDGLLTVLDRLLGKIAELGANRPHPFVSAHIHGQCQSTIFALRQMGHISKEIQSTLNDLTERAYTRMLQTYAGQTVSITIAPVGAGSAPTHHSLH